MAALRRFPWQPHLVLLTGVLIFVFPVFIALIGSTHDVGTIARGDMPLRLGRHAAENYRQAWALGRAERVNAAPVSRMMTNTLIMALVIASGKITISIISAFAVAFFRFPLRMFFFWMIFTYSGLIIPLIASATATLIFRQFFLTVPDELVEAAKIDGAGPMRFFWSILLPLSRTTIAALFVILFIYGWNQYLWP